MKKESLATKTASQKAAEIPCHIVHTLVIGSGTAGLNAAVQVRRNDIEDVMIISEGLQMGTSINTGSRLTTSSACGEMKRIRRIRSPRPCMQAAACTETWHWSKGVCRLGPL